MCFNIIYKNAFTFIKTFFKNYSDMWDTKTILVSLSISSSVASSFCIYQVHTETKVEYHSETKIQISCENGYKEYCLNGGDLNYLVHEDIVGCVCTWLVV